MIPLLISAAVLITEWETSERGSLLSRRKTTSIFSGNFSSVHTTVHSLCCAPQFHLFFLFDSFTQNFLMVVGVSPCFSFCHSKKKKEKKGTFTFFQTRCQSPIFFFGNQCPTPVPMSTLAHVPVVKTTPSPRDRCGVDVVYTSYLHFKVQTQKWLVRSRALERHF